jgi:hypothetical protein
MFTILFMTVFHWSIFHRHLLCAYHRNEIFEVKMINLGESLKIFLVIIGIRC